MSLFFQCCTSCGDVKTAKGYLQEDLNCSDTTDLIIGIKDKAIRIHAPFLIVHVDSRPGMPYNKSLNKKSPSPANSHQGSIHIQMPHLQL